MEKEVATHSSLLAWRIPGTAEPGGLPSMGSHRVGHDCSDLAAAAAESVMCNWAYWQKRKSAGVRSKDCVHERSSSPRVLGPAVTSSGQAGFQCPHGEWSWNMRMPWTRRWNWTSCRGWDIRGALFKGKESKANSAKLLLPVNEKNFPLPWPWEGSPGPQ